MYITQTQLEDRLTAYVVRQIYDDDVDGVPDASAIARVIEDAEAYVEGFLYDIYDLDVLRAQGENAPREVIRLCLDVAVAYAVNRHPEYIRANGLELLRMARGDLLDLRKGVTRLPTATVGTADVEPAENQGGVVQSGDPDDTEPADKFFIDPDSMGIF